MEKSHRYHKGEKVVCAFLDLRKVFDVIDHQILIGKLEKYRLHCKEQDWLKSYLSQRYQFVTCGTAQSQRRKVSYGVPQGSILGPTLFNIHINEISKACENCDVVLYADDTGIYGSSKDVSIAEQRVKDLPILDYECVVWGDCGKRNAQRLESLQNQAMRIILGANRKTCTQEMHTKLVLLSLKNRRRFFTAAISL